MGAACFAHLCREPRENISGTQFRHAVFSQQL